MKKYWKRGAFSLVAIMLVVVFATPAMAIVSTGRSEEMVFQSHCEKAGTLELKFTKDDVAIMAEFLASGFNTPRLDATMPAGTVRGTGNVIKIEVSLGSLNITEKVDPPPTLCKDIKDLCPDGSDILGAANLPIEHQDAVELSVIGQEVSDVVLQNLIDLGGDACGDRKDVLAYVWGEEGASKFFIYIVDIENNVDGTDNIDQPWNDQNNWPWIKVGLDETQVGGICPGNADHHTTICVDVSGYSNNDDLATLNISMDIEPENLTYTTSDSQIGHFQVETLWQQECESDKDGNIVGCPDEDSEFISLCPLDDPTQEPCTPYYRCIEVYGFEANEDYKFILRTNGETNNADTQDGVYLSNVTMYRESTVVDPYDPTATGDCTDSSNALMQRLASFYSTASGAYSQRISNLNCTYLAQYFQGVLLSDDINVAQSIKFCISYYVDANVEFEVGSRPQFWLEVTNANYCETEIERFEFEGAQFIECGGALESCMYFPYVVITSSIEETWSNGIVVTNLNEDQLYDNMEVMVKLYDVDGASKSATLTPATYPDIVFGKTFVFTISQLVNAMEWEVPSGTGWLWVQGNFPIDGYSFVTDGDFGGSSLPRVLHDCEDMLDLR